MANPLRNSARLSILREARSSLTSNAKSIPKLPATLKPAAASSTSISHEASAIGTIRCKGHTSEWELHKLAKHLVYDPHDKETIFSERGAKMVTQIFLAALELEERPLPYLASLINLGVNEVAAQLNAVSPDLAQTFLGATYKPGKDYEKNEFRVDSWETVSARLYAFLTADMVRNFAGSDFTAHDLYFAEKPVFVFIRFHESDLLSMAPLIKFVCESLMMELLNAYDHAPDEMKASARQILWSMDEAGRIGIPNLPEHASTVVGRKISLSLSAQSRSQFNAIYGHDRTKNLFNNIRTQLVFCQADFDTAQHYSIRMGDTSGYAHSAQVHVRQAPSPADGAVRANPAGTREDIPDSRKPNRNAVSTKTAAPRILAL